MSRKSGCLPTHIQTKAVSCGRAIGHSPSIGTKGSRPEAYPVCTMSNGRLFPDLQSALRSRSHHVHTRLRYPSGGVTPKHRRGLGCLRAVKLPSACRTPQSWATHVEHVVPGILLFLLRFYVSRRILRGIHKRLETASVVARRTRLRSW